ncbi:MAG: antibiotic biosynthesis monooxygenase family protein [bacterium]
MDFVTVQFISKPRKHHEFLLTIRSLVKLTRQEPGCTGLRFFHDAEDGMVSLLIGTWESPEDLHRYFQSELFQVLLGTASLLRGDPEVRVNGFP